LENAMADMCDRCSELAQSMPSAIKFAQLSPSVICTAPNFLITLHETAAELIASRCRICRILGHSMSSKLEPPIEITLEGFENYVDVHFRPARKQGEYRELYLRYSDKPFNLKWRRFNASDEIGPAQVSRISEWLQFCRQQHQNCIPTHQDGALRGLRVIDCTERRVISAPAACSYVALSYVWGENLGYEQLFSNLKADNLPQTIQDSIEVTRMLGFQYLWVDRYVCIQHSL
jgi:hypothetical protein